jgi:hypothetical protein
MREEAKGARYVQPVQNQFAKHSMIFAARLHGTNEDVRDLEITLSEVNGVKNYSSSDESWYSICHSSNPKQKRFQQFLILQHVHLEYKRVLPEAGLATGTPRQQQHPLTPAAAR